MIAEFEAVRAQGFSGCFLVDDNFIGNKAKAKELLHVLIDWQKKNGYPLKFATEASINLADDAELMALMVEANILQVFIGVELPRKTSLSEIQKIQNVRGDSQLHKLQRVRDAGIVVTAGFIVGFDSDDEDIFDEQFDFITEAGIAMSPIALSDADPHHAALRPAESRRQARLLRSGGGLPPEEYEPRAADGRLRRSHEAALHTGGVLRPAVPRL